VKTCPDDTPEGGGDLSEKTIEDGDEVTRLDTKSSQQKPKDKHGKGGGLNVLQD
jgi:hypothetical protein